MDTEAWTRGTVAGEGWGEGTGNNKSEALTGE